MLRRLGLLLTPALLLIAGLLSGCRLRRPPELAVPVSNWPGYEYLYLAEQKGLARARGLDLRLIEFPDPQAIVHAYLRGDVAIAQLTSVEAVDICGRAPERCPVVVLVLDESRGADQVVARRGIDTIAQLRGRRVGVTPSTLGPFVLSRALERHGLTLADVTIQTMTLAAMPEALASGRLEAAALFPPYSEYAARQGGTKWLFDSSEIPGEIFDILVVDPAAYGRRRSELVRLVAAWQDAHELRRAAPAEATALMAQREGLSPEELRQAERGLVYTSLRQQLPMLASGGPLERNLRAVRRVQEKLSLLRPGSPLPRVSNVIIGEALR